MNVSAKQLLDDFAHALKTFLDVDEEGEIPAWDRTWVFKLDQPNKEIFAELPCSEKPPRAYLLMVRKRDGEKTYELWWCPEHGVPSEQWPIVELTESGDAVVVAGSVSDWIDALIYTGGMLGGGAEEDLDDAREEATSTAVSLGNALLDELDRELGDAELLGERWEEALDKWGDGWMEAVEGLD